MSSSSSSSSGDWYIDDINGNRIWTSTEANTCPSALDFSNILNLQYDDNDIHHITSQIIRNAPAKSIGLLLTCVACNTWRSNNIIDPMKINSLKNANPKTVCGRVFRKGDIVWSCRSCAKDATCVQCDDCFRNSNHEGHEVYFHRESEKEGGCCDCGDPSAWSKSGNCTKHNHEIDPNIDPLSIIPQGLMKSLKPVLIAISGVISSYVTCIARGYQKVGYNDFLNNFIEENQENRLVMRLHNDDIHTYEGVTEALINCGEQPQRAETLTKLVDKAGEALVYTIEGKKGLNERKWNTYYECLSIEAGLLFSIVPEHVYLMGPKITSVLSWLQSIGTMNDGIRRLISQSMIINVNDLPDCTNAYPSVSQFRPSQIFAIDADNKFPSVIQHLASPSPDDFIKLDSKPYDLALHPFNTCHRNCLSLMIAASPYLGKSVKKALNDIVLVYQHDILFKSAYSQSLTVLYPMLYFLFSKSVGTVENTIFNTTVQVYTCRSIVRQMSSDGISDRVLKDISVEEGGTNVHIAKILSSTLQNTFETVDFLDLEFPVNHLYHLRLRNYCSALHQACRDFEYCVEDPCDAIRICADKRDPGVINDLLSMYAAIESAHMHKRLGERERHVERESDKWQDYWKIIADLESISTKLVSSAFFTQIPKHNMSESLVLQAEQEYDNSLQEALHQVTNKILQKIDEWTTAFEVPLNEQFFKITDEPLLCLGHRVVFRAYRRYQVSISPVSINLPLHHLMSKIITYSCFGGIDLESTLKIFSNYPDAVVSLGDYSLRSLSFVAQVFSDMWKRNGAPTANIAYLYTIPPYARYNKELDIHAIQIAMAAAGPDSIIALAIDRFEVLSLLETKDYNNAIDPIKGSKGYLLIHLLRTLIHLANQIPSVLEIIRKEKSSIDLIDIEGVSTAIRREVSHFLLGGSKNISNFSKLRGLIGSDTTVTDDLIKDALDDLCTKRDMGDDRVSFEPKDIVYDIYDPEFNHLSQKQTQLALDTVKAYRKKLIESKKLQGKEDFDILPIIATAAIRTPHPQLLCIRNFLYRPFTFSLLERCMRVTLDSITPSVSASTQTGSNACAIISKVVHLITLQIHCFPDFKRDVCKGIACYSSAKYFNRSQSFVEEAHDQSEIEKNAEIEKKFILTLADVYLHGVVRSDDMYESGLKWVLRELSYNEIVRTLLSAKNITFKSSFDETLEKKKKSAQDRLNAKMKAQIASFNALIEDMSDDEDDDTGLDNTTSGKELPTCIVCRQNTSESLGYLSYLQASSILKQTITQNDDYQSQVMNSIYRVVALNGCDILKSNDNNATVRSHLQQGDHILVASQVGRWLKVVAPMVGWCALFNSGEDNVIAQLYPVKELQFNRFGPNRIHVSSCGHCMHRSCWETYHASTLSNSWNNNLIGRNAIDVEKGELQCPLCRGINNALLPYNPPDVASSSMKLATPGAESLSYKLSVSYNWALIGNLLTSPTTHTSGLSNNEKFFADSCFTQLVPSWDDDVTEYMDIDEITGKKNLYAIRCIHSCWSAAAYTLMSATCNGRWIHSNAIELLKNDSTELTMITQLILCLRQSANLFATLDEYNDFVLNPLQRLLSGSISSILIENFGGVESISDLISAKGSRLIDAGTCNLQECYMTLLQLPSYTVTHQSLLPNSKRLSMMLDLFHKKGIPEKYLWNLLHIPLLSHDLHVIAMAVTTCISSVQSLDECVGILCLARLVQILIEPASLGFMAINKSLKRERSDLPKTASWSNESKLLSELRSHVCSICKIPIAENLCHEDELTEHILNSWLSYLEYACALSFIMHKIVEPENSTYESYVSALSPSGTQIARVNKILALLGIPDFNDLLSSIGMFELSAKWSTQFHSVSPEPLDANLIQKSHPIIPSSFDNKNIEPFNVMEFELSSSLSTRVENDNKFELNYNDRDSTMDDDDESNNNQTVQGNDDDSDDDGVAMNEDIIEGNMQAIFETLLGALQPPQNNEAGGAETSPKWKLIGVYPNNKLVDEPLPDMFGATVTSFHSSTPLLGSISGTHIINGLNGERLEHVFPDMSQMGFSIKNRGGLIKLPSLYTDLYQICKNPEGPSGIILDDPAICLVCGRICSAGNRKTQPGRNLNIDPGEVTLHSRECGAGIGVFFLAHKCTVLLVRGSRSMFYPSFYVDQHGESGEGLHSNRPLYLSAKKYQKLEELYLKHQIGSEITRHRSTADRNIRANWY